jgi:hypothetical protein
VVGHDDIAYHHKAITPPHFFEHCQKQIASLRARQPGLPMITTAGNEMQVVRAVIAPGMVGHRASLLGAARISCDIRPRRPHLYKKRKGGPAPFTVKLGQPPHWSVSPGRSHFGRLNPSCRTNPSVQ